MDAAGGSASSLLALLLVLPKAVLVDQQPVGSSEESWRMVVAEVVLEEVKVMLHAFTSLAKDDDNNKIDTNTSTLQDIGSGAFEKSLHLLTHQSPAPT